MRRYLKAGAYSLHAYVGKRLVREIDESDEELGRTSMSGSTNITGSPIAFRPPGPLLNTIQLYGPNACLGSTYLK